MTIQQHVSTMTPIRIDTQAQFDTLWELLFRVYPETAPKVKPPVTGGISVLLRPCRNTKEVEWSWAHTNSFISRSDYNNPVTLSTHLYKR
jgi:hypothetical protein